MTLNASVSGPVVYLDNWAIYDLAEGDSTRRKRFIVVRRAQNCYTGRHPTMCPVTLCPAQRFGFPLSW